MTKYSLISGLTLAASLAFAGQAFAHAHLKTSVPTDNAVVAKSPSELDLTFTEELNLKFTGVKVTGPDNAAVKTDDAMLMDGDKGLMVPIPEKLAPGKYSVEWHALSADGHKTNGAFSFTIKP